MKRTEPESDKDVGNFVFAGDFPPLVVNVGTSSDTTGSDKMKAAFANIRKLIAVNRFMFFVSK